VSRIEKEEAKWRGRCIKFDRGSASCIAFPLPRCSVFICSRFKNLLAILLSSPFTTPTFTFVQHVEPIWSRHHAPNMRGVAERKEREQDKKRERKNKRERERERERSQAAPTPNSRRAIKPLNENHWFNVKLSN